MQQTEVRGQINLTEQTIMKLSSTTNPTKNRKSYFGGVSLPLLWLLGVPVPVLILIYFFR
jgi:hypothetical protein